ncbi:outer membrane protein assembly factor BamA [Pelagibacterales bacterium SAG-MED39]|nr:outer membrane protein assembly factor BamA [Pelagibacterales bacterium SAG-MED39]
MITNSYAEIIKKIEIVGNDRVSNATILNFSELKKGDDVSLSNINKSLKSLYDTNFFEDVSINIENNLLTIKVKEYAVIQVISFGGIKRKETIKELKEQISLKEKNPFNESLIKNDLNKILNILKSSGFYFAEATVQVEENQNNTINIIYNVNMGEKATIKEIQFIGDKKYKKRKLSGIITSEENKFWKIISKGKYLNISRINLDKRLLKNFYLNKGYYQVEINDAYSKIIDNENFVLTFNINAGKKFLFGDMKLNLPDDFDPNKFTKLNKIFKKSKNETYSFNKIEDILDEIENIALFENYEFIDAKVIETITDNRVNFTFNIEESAKVYVEKINIFGNNITSEEFIRDNLLVDEGDPFNKILHTKSINNLKSKGLFSKVQTDIVDTDDEGKKIVNISFEEKATGEISASAGVGTDGTSFGVGIKEKNFNGKGIELEANVALSDDAIRGLFYYTHPNFAYSDRSLTTSLESTVTDKLTDSGYKSTLNAVGLGTRYEQFDNLFFAPSISISDETIETTSTASAAYKKQEGSYFDSIFNYSLTYDKRNLKFQPTDGFVSRWSQNIPIFSNTPAITNGYTFTAYSEPVDDMVISTGIYTAAVNSLSDDDVRVSQRLYAPSSRLRGFKSGSVGPKDGSDFVGGNYIATFNTSSTIPYILQTMESVDLKVFLDVGNVWGVDYSSSIDDSNKIRSSSGIALEILSPVGPLSFSYAQVLSKASTDQTESFKFQLGTTF